MESLHSVLPQMGEKVAYELVGAFVGGEERGDYGDGVRAGIDDAAGVGAGDASDGDQRLGGESARAADAFEADDGVGLSLVAVAKTGPMAM